MTRSTRAMSQETLSPSHHDASRTTPVWSSAAALLSTMMGGGMLTIPFAFSQCGILGGCFLLALSSVGGGFSLYILIAAARRTGAANYGVLADDAFGRGASVFVSSLTLTLTLMCIVAYSILLKDMLGSGLEILGIEHGYKNKVLLLLLTIITLPISLNRSLGGLKFITPLSLGSMIMLTLAVLLRGSEHAYNHWETVTYHLWPESSYNVFRALPIFVLAFMCHFNALEMHSELVNPTRTRLKRVIIITIAVSTIIYFLFGIAGYLWAGDNVQGDILRSFDADDQLIFIGRFGLLIAMLGNIPLMVLPARQIIVDLLIVRTLISEVKAASPGGAMHSEMSALKSTSSAAVVYVPSGQANAPPQSDSLLWWYCFNQSEEESGFAEPTALGHLLLTSFIVLGAGLASVICPSVEVIWGLCGSSVGILLALSIPSGICKIIRIYLS